MAIGAARTANVPADGRTRHGVVLVAIDDATDATTNIGAPATIDEAGFHWLEVPAGYTRCIPYLVCDVGVTSVGTEPIVYVIGAQGVPGSDGAMATTVEFARLDSAASGGPGITLDFDNTNDLVNGTYQFGGFSTLDAVDLLDFPYIGIGVKTAAATIGGTGTPRVWVRFIR